MAQKNFNLPYHINEASLNSNDTFDSIIKNIEENQKHINLLNAQLFLGSIHRFFKEHQCIEKIIVTGEYEYDDEGSTSLNLYRKLEVNKDLLLDLYNKGELVNKNYNHLLSETIKNNPEKLNNQDVVNEIIEDTLYDDLYNLFNHSFISKEEIYRRMNEDVNFDKHTSFNELINIFFNKEEKELIRTNSILAEKVTLNENVPNPTIAQEEDTTKSKLKI